MHPNLPAALALTLALLLTGGAQADRSLDPGLLERARAARDCAQAQGMIAAGGDKLALIDFTRPSREKRLWVVDEETGAVLFHELVAHGKNTGLATADTFSDVPGSLQSSLGLYVTAEPYVGKHGYSLRLDGLEPGINGNARDRAIVVHGADYATSDFVDQHGRLGRSWGCPAVAKAVARPLIDTIAEGTPLFAWHEDSDWSKASALARCSP